MRTITTTKQAVDLLNELAAERGRNVLLLGAPGSGRTMLARRVAWSLPWLEPASDERRDLALLFYGSGLLDEQDARNNTTRPFRAPHHTCSTAAMVGGGSRPRVRPGEVSLAHSGVLFLDEVVEFRRHTIDAVKDVLRDGESRFAGGTAYPARPWCVLGAAAPCPCGYLWGERRRRCACPEAAVERYNARLDSLVTGLFHETIRVALNRDEAAGLASAVQDPRRLR